MTIKLGVLMDPIANITIKKDSTFAILLEAQQRGWKIFYMEQKDLFLQDGIVHAQMKSLQLFDNPKQWFSLHEINDVSVNDLDIILMRKDPPFDMEYIYTTYLLELIEKKGTLVVNSPQSLRDANEKLFTAWFPQCCPQTLVSCNMQRLRDFLKKQQDIIVKPLDSMGGHSIFRLTENSPNINATLELMTKNGKRQIMAQTFIPEIVNGDKRIILIDGKPIPYVLARLPAAGETRANLAAGGTGQAQEMSKHDHWICQQVGPVLCEKKILLAGLDVIGNYLTEINITSPTCIREIDRHYNINISATFLDCVEKYL